MVDGAYSTEWSGVDVFFADGTVLAFWSDQTVAGFVSMYDRTDDVGDVSMYDHE